MFTGAGLIRSGQVVFQYAAEQLAGGIGTATISSATLAADGTVEAGVDLAAASQAVLPLGAIVDAAILGGTAALFVVSAVYLIQQCHG